MPGYPVFVNSFSVVGTGSPLVIPAGTSGVNATGDLWIVAVWEQLGDSSMPNVTATATGNSFNPLTNVLVTDTMTGGGFYGDQGRIHVYYKWRTAAEVNSTVTISSLNANIHAALWLGYRGVDQTTAFTWTSDQTQQTGFTHSFRWPAMGVLGYDNCAIVGLNFTSTTIGAPATPDFTSLDTLMGGQRFLDSVVPTNNWGALLAVERFHGPGDVAIPAAFTPVDLESYMAGTVILALRPAATKRQFGAVPATFPGYPRQVRRGFSKAISMDCFNTQALTGNAGDKKSPYGRIFRRYPTNNNQTMDYRQSPLALRSVVRGHADGSARLHVIGSISTHIEAFNLIEFDIHVYDFTTGTWVVDVPLSRSGEGGDARHWTTSGQRIVNLAGAAGHDIMVSTYIKIHSRTGGAGTMAMQYDGNDNSSLAVREL